VCVGLSESLLLTLHLSDLALRNVLVSSARPEHGSTLEMMDGTGVICSVSGMLIFFDRDILIGALFLTSKSIDFGLSRLLGDYHAAYYSSNEGQLPVRWLSNEAVLRGRYSVESDVYAFGIALVELLVGGRPFPGVSNAEIVDEFVRDDPDVSGRGPCPRFIREARPQPLIAAGFADEVPEQIWDIVVRCCSWDYASRPTFSTLQEELATLGRAGRA
jgi:serine/threonine protein kinase